MQPITLPERQLKSTLVDALREYREEEESLGVSLFRLLALLLGLYKLIFLLLRLNIESFRPSSGDFISFLLYSTWYGMDSILGFIWTILLFWGFTKLFLRFSKQFQRLFGGISTRFVGDSARFINLSSGRNLKRLGSYRLHSRPRHELQRRSNRQLCDNDRLP